MRKNLNTKTKTDTVLLVFFLLAFGISWLLWIPAALMDPSAGSPISFILYLVGGFGPTIAGLLMIGRTMDRTDQQDVFQRLIDIHRIDWRWGAFILTIFPVLGGLTIQIYRLLYGSYPALPALQGFTGKPGDIVTLVFIAIQVMLMGPLAEEIGWRGFALDRLFFYWNAPMASLIIGIIWGLWHLPLFLFPGSMYYEWGIGSSLFWLFLLRMTALSVIMTLVYVHTNRSILSAILLHFMFNFTYGFLQPSPLEIHLYGTLLISLVAIIPFFILKEQQSGKQIKKTT